MAARRKKTASDIEPATGTCQATYSNGIGACNPDRGGPCTRPAKFIDEQSRHVCGYHNGNSARVRHKKGALPLPAILKEAYQRLKELEQEVKELEEKQREILALTDLVKVWENNHDSPKNHHLSVRRRRKRKNAEEDKR